MKTYVAAEFDNIKELPSTTKEKGEAVIVSADTMGLVLIRPEAIPLRNWFSLEAVDFVTLDKHSVITLTPEDPSDIDEELTWDQRLELADSDLREFFDTIGTDPIKPGIQTLVEPINAIGKDCPYQYAFAKWLAYKADAEFICDVQTEMKYNHLTNAELADVLTNI